MLLFAFIIFNLTSFVKMKFYAMLLSLAALALAHQSIDHSDHSQLVIEEKLEALTAEVVTKRTPIVFQGKGYRGKGGENGKIPYETPVTPVKPTVPVGKKEKAGNKTKAGKKDKTGKKVKKEVKKDKKVKA